jgi:ribonuclease BN (tRNA processing enzyme)
MTAAASTIVLLGTGTPNADPARSGPAVAIVANQTPYLIDFGPGVVRRAAAAYRAGVVELEVSELKRAFVTHLHSDHTAGYPDLILTPWVLGRTAPLEVYGPPGLEAMTQHLLAAYQADIAYRLAGLEPINATGHHVDVHEVEPGIIYEDGNVRVEAFCVNHGAWREHTGSDAYGYKVYTGYNGCRPDRVIVISGDTAPAPGCVEAYRGCDVLIHEVQSAVGLARRSPAWRRYHAAVHTTSVQLAAIASEVQPELLILYHQLFHGVTEADLLQEVQARYDGDVVSGKDLEVY